MTESEFLSMNGELIIFLDAESCILDTRTPLVNCLGVVANIQDNILASPWKDNDDIVPSEKNTNHSEYTSLEHGRGAGCADIKQENSTTNNTGRKYEQCVADIVTFNGRDHATTLSHEINVTSRVTTSTDNSQSSDADINELLLSKLRTLIHRIRSNRSCTKQTIQEASDIADYLLRNPNNHSRSKVSSFADSFNGASVANVRIFEELVSDIVVPTLDVLSVTPIRRFIEGIAIASYDGTEDLGLLCDIKHCVSRLCAAASLDDDKYHITLVLLSYIPEAIQHLISIAGLTTEYSSRLHLTVAHIEDVHKYTNSSKNTEYILYPSESYITQDIYDTLKHTNKHMQVLGSLGNSPLSAEALSTTSGTKTSRDKVDLHLEPHFDSLKTLGPVYIKFSNPINLEGTVVKGFGRGASFLGIPTANLDCRYIPHLLPGVYFGRCWLHNNEEVSSNHVLRTILSIGFNPHFDDDSYSVEPYIYHTFQNPLLGQTLSISIEGFLRTEARFTSVQGLVAAIQQDLIQHKIILRAQNGGNRED